MRYLGPLGQVRLAKWPLGLLVQWVVEEVRGVPRVDEWKSMGQKGRKGGDTGGWRNLYD